MTYPCDEQVAPGIVPPKWEGGGGECDCDFSDYYTKEEVDELVSAVESGEFVIVEQLPPTGSSKTIYLVPKTGGGYTEWVYIDGAWEEFGDTEIDLSDYYTKTQTDDLLDEKQDVLEAGTNIFISGNIVSAPDVYSKTEVDEALEGYVTLTEMQTALADKQDVLEAGTNIDLTNNVVSAPNVYSKTETDALLDEKADADNVYTKSEVDALLEEDVFIATYNVTTAQEILDYIDSSKEPFAPMLVKRGTDYYTPIYVSKSGDSAVVRVLGTSGGEYYSFTYTVTDANWVNSSYALQKKLVSGTDIKTINGESVLGSGNIDIDLSDYYNKTETDALLDEKQDTLTAGTGIDITNGVISSTIDADVYVPVTTLPPADEADQNKIYLTPKEGGGVQEWHVIEEDSELKWDLFGEEEIDLSGYYDKTETDALLAEKQDVLEAGENIDITGDVISATFTKEKLLEILGVTEKTITIADENNNEVTLTVLGYVGPTTLLRAGRNELTISEYSSTPIQDVQLTNHDVLSDGTVAKLTITGITLNGVAQPDIEAEATITWSGDRWYWNGDSAGASIGGYYFEAHFTTEDGTASSPVSAVELFIMNEGDQDGDVVVFESLRLEV